MKTSKKLCVVSKAATNFYNESFQRRQQYDALMHNDIEETQMFCNPCMSRYMVAPMRDNDNFKEAIRIIQNGPKKPKGKYSKETIVFRNFINVMGETENVLLF